ncbi:MAG TPA: hypothetical protein PLY93_09035, partial [Turneriella sp.]|nr:hypothetical protein [Turneriella sp.]
MKATQTPPSNQPLVEYEDFSFVAGKIITSTKHIYGRLKTIRAHTHLECITVEYERINKIEALCEEIDKKKRYAVSFEAQYIIYPTKKKSPLSLRTGTTRIRYWNFSESDFFKLNFLRSVHDKKLFLAHFSQSDLLFFIAAAFFHSEPRLSEAAYKQAVKYLSKENFSENDARAFLFYIRKILKGDAPKIATIIHTFQKVDTAALFTVYLLKLLARYSYFDLSLQK